MLSVLLGIKMKNKLKKEDITTEYYIEFRGTLFRYRIVIVYYLIIMVYYSIIEILEFYKVIESTSNYFLIASLLWNLINGFYLVGFIFSIEKWKQLGNILLCRHLFISIRESNLSSMYELTF